jgi:Cu-Zn family superoxide dismutase
VTLRAVAVLRPTEGQQARGQVTFTQRKGHVHVAVRLAGLSPGKHGFHIHQLGDCRAADASSAGGHFAPEGNPHGGPTDRARHAGDLGNVVANAEGEVREVIKDPRLVLAGPYSIVGRAVVVHAKADDLESQPAGAAGARVACGVIGKAAQVKRQGN